MSALPKPQLFEPERPKNKKASRNFAGAYSKAPPQPGEILTTGRIAALLRVSPKTVTTWIDTGAMKGYRLPGGTHDRRVHALDLVEFALSNGMFRKLAECIVADERSLYRCRIHDRWGQVVARVAPIDAPEAAGIDWLPDDEPRYELKSASPEAFQVLVNAAFRFEDGR